MSEPQPFHHLFGLSWMDLCEGSCIEVEEELDLSYRRQLLDLVLVRQESGHLPRLLPDDFEELARPNLVTFKSHQEALDAWALQELVGHYVNYRKQRSPSPGLLPSTAIRLLAVCVRYPHNLAQEVALEPLRPAVYQVRGLGLSIRMIVVQQLPPQEQNAMLLLFSANEEQLRYGQEHYRPRSPETSTLLYKLLRAYQEDPEMANKKLQEFVRQTMEEMLQELPPEERLKGLPVEEIIKALPPELRAILEQHGKTNGSQAPPKQDSPSQGGGQEPPP